MLGKIFEHLAKGYFFLLTVAAGGLVGANAAAFVPVIAEFFFNPEWKPTQPATMLRWVHGGWLVGAALGLVGAVLQWRRSANRAGDEEQHRRHREAFRKTVPSARGVFVSAGVGAFCCGLLGAMLGATFLLLWFSLAYSPF